MILVDTSIWIDHWHAADRTLTKLLNERSVLGHILSLGKLPWAASAGETRF